MIHATRKVDGPIDLDGRRHARIPFGAGKTKSDMVEGGIERIANVNPLTAAMADNRTLSALFVLTPGCIVDRLCNTARPC